MNDETVIDPVEPVPPIAHTPGKVCPNCGAPRLGPYCYACGQPEKGLIRHLASVLHDFLDTVFNLDSRTFRTLFPLFFRPGWLTLEYFAGRRVRYVTPFRLFFFLCVTAFLAVQWSISLTGAKLDFNTDDNAIERAKTPEEVTAARDAALAGLTTAEKAPGVPAKAMEKARAKIEREAEKRIERLQKKNEQAAKTGTGADATSDDEDDGFITIGNTVWDPKKNPVAIGWLPAAVNAKLNDMLAHMRDNIRGAKNDPMRLVDGMFSRLPPVLFALMPIFAMLLKIFYIFKRRLYMEHLMVALHSHAFICFSILLLALLDLFKDSTTVHASALTSPIGWVLIAICVWLPVYLFIMQKRVYKQGWIMTTLKYFMIGFCYTFILGFGLAAAFLLSLALT